jgi:hypothetical protein
VHFINAVTWSRILADIPAEQQSELNLEELLSRKIEASLFVCIAKESQRVLLEDWLGDNSPLVEIILSLEVGTASCPQHKYTVLHPSPIPHLLSPTP